MKNVSIKLSTALMTLLAVVCGVTSCRRDLFQSSEDTPVSFMVGMRGSELTKAAYSGEIVDNKERIDWQEGDILRIYCAAASMPAEKYADYVVSSVESDGVNSQAHINAQDIGLRWGAKTAQHTFHAVYPSPQTSGITASISGKDVTCSLAAEQNTLAESVMESDGNYTVLPDLKWMLMTAKAGPYTPESGIPEGDDVFLSFQPMTTAISFTIINGTTADIPLTKVMLLAQESTISGSFSVDLDASPASDGYLPAGGSPSGKEVSINLAGKGEEGADISLAPGKSMTFTFFLAPISDVDDLTFRFYKDGSSWMQTHLNYTDGGGVKFLRCRKSEIDGVMLPEGVQWTVKYAPGVDPWNPDGQNIDPKPNTNMRPFVTSWDTGIDDDLEMTACSFEFALQTESQETVTFYNTTSDSAPVDILINSKKTWNEVTTDEDWTVKSYRIGSDEPVAVDGGVSFTAGGVNVTKDGNTLNVKALSRADIIPSSHDFWLNQNPERTENLEWSPEDWTNATASGPIDLSRYNFHTETTDNPMTTANCYIIRHAGTYKLPLVYGNYVVQGLTAEWTWSSPLGCFIENNDSAESCEIVWQDEAEVIKDISIIGSKAESYNASNVRFLQFTVDKDAVCQNNAIVAVKNGDGEVLWSWHIWTTNNPALLDDAIPVTNYNGKTNNFFPLPCLGWIDSEEYLERKALAVTLEQKESGNTLTINLKQPNILSGNGVYYQFGRKDPMCRKDNPATGTFKIKDATGVGFYEYDEGTFYYGESYQSPKTTLSIEGKLESSTWRREYRRVVDYGYDPGVYFYYKGYYDPSPAGYWLPVEDEFSGFTTTGRNSATKSQFNVVDSESYDKGWHFYTVPGPDHTDGSTIFFSASGYRDGFSGAVCNVNSNGGYWINDVQSNANAFSFYFDGNTVNPLSYFIQSFGLSVRPVQE